MVIIIKKFYSIINVYRFERKLLLLSQTKDNPYHNFRHAFCVTQIVYSLLKTLSSDLKMDLDSWGVLIVAAIAHDVAYGDLQLIHSYFINITVL